MLGAMSQFSFCSLCWYDGPARMAVIFFFSSPFYLLIFISLCIRNCRQEKKNISWLTIRVHCMKSISCPFMCLKPKLQHPSFPKTHIMALEWATIDEKTHSSIVTSNALTRWNFVLISFFINLSNHSAGTAL